MSLRGSHSYPGTAPDQPMMRAAKPKRAAAQKAARRVKQPVAPAIEAVVVDVVEEPVSGGTGAN